MPFAPLIASLCCVSVSPTPSGSRRASKDLTASPLTSARRDSTTSPLPPAGRDPATTPLQSVNHENISESNDNIDMEIASNLQLTKITDSESDGDIATKNEVTNACDDDKEKHDKSSTFSVESSDVGVCVAGADPVNSSPTEPVADESEALPDEEEIDSKSLILSAEG